MNAGRVAPFLVIVLLVSSCTGGADEEGQSGDITLAQASPNPSAKWAGLGVGDYTMTYSSVCGENGWVTDGPVTVRVIGGLPEVVDGNAPLEVATVDLLFAVLNEAQEGQAEVVEYELGPMGVPTRIKIDWDLNAVDDEFCVDIKAFQATPAG
jgi:hypothetical protein